MYRQKSASNTNVYSVKSISLHSLIASHSIAFPAATAITNFLCILSELVLSLQTHMWIYLPNTFKRQILTCCIYLPVLCSLHLTTNLATRLPGTLYSIVYLIRLTHGHLMYENRSQSVAFICIPIARRTIRGCFLKRAELISVWIQLRAVANQILPEQLWPHISADLRRQKKLHDGHRINSVS